MMAADSDQWLIRMSATFSKVIVAVNILGASSSESTNFTLIDRFYQVGGVRDLPLGDTRLSWFLPLREASVCTPLLG